MFVQNEALWAEYLEIDEETRERKLRDDTPEEIRQLYEDYLKQLEENPSEMLPK